MSHHPGPSEVTLSGLPAAALARRLGELCGADGTATLRIDECVIDEHAAAALEDYLARSRALRSLVVCDRTLTPRFFKAGAVRVTCRRSAAGAPAAAAAAAAPAP